MTLEQLEQELAEMVADNDLPMSTTIRQLEEHRLKRMGLTGRIQAARVALSAVADLDARITPDAKWLDMLTTARTALCEQLLALPPRGPDSQGLKLSISIIDRGFDWHHEGMPARIPLDGLLEQAGLASPHGTLAETVGAAWRGSIFVVEQRLVTLRKRRAEVQQQVDGALRDADEPSGARPPKPAKLRGYNADGTLDEIAVPS